MGGTDRLARLRLGDEEAWRDWREEAARRVARWVMRAERNPSRRDELRDSIVSGAALRIQGGRGPQSDEHLWPWCFRFARDRIVEWIRAEERRRKRERTLGMEVFDLPAPEASVDGGDVRRWLEAVPRARWRRALRLRFIERWTVPGIAHALGVRETTVRVWFHRARKHLKGLAERETPCPRG